MKHNRIISSTMLATILVAQPAMTWAAGVKTKPVESRNKVTVSAKIKSSRTSDEKTVADLVDKKVVDENNTIKDLAEESRISERIAVYNSLPKVSGKEALDILDTSERLDKETTTKDSNPQKRLITINYYNMTSDSAGSENIKGFYDTTTISREIDDSITYEELKDINANVKNYVTSIFYIKESEVEDDNSDLKELKLGESINIDTAYRVIVVFDENVGKEEEPKEKYNPKNDPTVKFPDGVIDIDYTRDFTFGDVNAYVKYLEGLDKENQKRIKQLSKKDQEKYKSSSARGMLEFKGMVYYDTGSVKETVLQKNLIISMVNLLKTRVDVLTDSQIKFLGDRIDDARILVKDSKVDEAKIKKYTDAFNAIRELIVDASNSDNVTVRKSPEAQHFRDLGKR